MPARRLRHSVRALLLDDADRVLLCRFAVTHPIGGLWTAPGGGIEPGETRQEALRRELREEVGFTLDDTAQPVWRQRVIPDDRVPRYDGVVNDYFLVRTTGFTPHGDLGETALRAENIDGFRWWSREELTGYAGDEVFSPRAFPTLYVELLAAGPATEPRVIGL